MTVSVKDISIESFLGNLLFIGIDSEMQREGVRGERKGRDVTLVSGMATFNEYSLYNLQCILIYSVECA